jgi:hypothetical protein
MKNSLFWITAQQVVVISYWRYGTTSQSHLHGSRIQKDSGFLTPEDGAGRLTRNVGKKLPTTRCIINPKNAVVKEGNLWIFWIEEIQDNRSWDLKGLQCLVDSRRFPFTCLCWRYWRQRRVLASFADIKL